MPNASPIPLALIDALRYEDGALYWKEARQGVGAGKACVSVNGSGYKIIQWRGKKYKQARVIWAMHHGNTDLVIDHINRDKTDNRIENLRAITQHQNQFNSDRGVTWIKARNKWRVQWSSKHIAVTPDLFEAWCIRKSLESHHLSS